MALHEDPERLRRERDLYRALLLLAQEEEADVEPFLSDALALIVEVVGARRGYLELTDDKAGTPGPHFWIARGSSEEDVVEIREAISRGVIAEALATGQTLATDAAHLDPRLSTLGSVRRKGIGALICAPVGAPPPLGVLYVQDRVGAAPFSEEDRLLTEAFARTVALLSSLLLLRRRSRDERDPTLPFRRRLVHAEDIVGRSAALAALFKPIVAVATREVGVLFTGPPGTGKTRFAKLVHDNSARAKGPLVQLNCAAIPEALFESELFGAEPGAHATATRRSEGKVAAAERGTIFLDEVGEMPLPLQSKLLRFIETREYYPLGRSRPLRADVRVIAATNADLAAAVEEGRFRRDLYDRLDIVSIAVPSLSERREDIPEIVRHLSAHYVEEDRLPRIQPSEGAIAAAVAAEWPGNVRQLGNRVRKALLLAAEDGVLQIEHHHLFPDGHPSGKAGSAGGSPVTFQEATRAFQAALVRRALEESGWNIRETAARLDLTRSHMYNLIKAFRLGRP